MNFLFHTLSLTSSGGSRVLCNLATYLSERGHNVTIILERNRIAFPIHKNVKVLLLNEFGIKNITPKVQGDTEAFQNHIAKKKEKNKERKREKLRHKYKTIESINEWKKYILKLATYPVKRIYISKLIKKIAPDVIASHNMYYFLEHYKFYKNNNFYVVLHNSPKQVFQERTVKSIFPLSTFYNNTPCLGVSQGVSHEMKEIFPFISDKSKTIYNPVDIKYIKKMADEAIDVFFHKNRYIVTVSSLAPGKKIDRTIKSFASLNDKDVYLVILGDGEEKANLEKLALTLGVSERVLFTGFIENPWPYMKHAEFMSFTSNYEGFGQVLVECLATGTPVVSTNCQSGPSEILVGELSQYLVDIKDRDECAIVNDLSNMFNEILNNPPTITNDAIKRFSKEHTVRQWESL
ncbi:glycosyltransferase [Vibrio vulnificus]|nr:glycosyltransferase [Vibrio vulnificus]EHZ2745623.1 glycosyltransferase [Vibrio vulnificus]EKO5170356.1 glycosyltransferase [Vibrio vulnificus]ELP4434996.1 glycosyltransferase [Vibrio vulnificus]MBN8034126.1 glycosyltransferase [Vibrio vulnificus]MCA3953692.1 glycosyltransferase [Vibrio vulnificus]